MSAPTPCCRRARAPSPATPPSPVWTCAALAANAPMFSGVKHVPVTLSATTRFTVASGGALALADFDITAAGEVPFAAMKDKALHVRSLQLVGHYDGAGRTSDCWATSTWTPREAQVRLKGTRRFLRGCRRQAGAGACRTAASASWPWTCRACSPQPVGYQALALAADYLTGPRQFDITKFQAHRAGLCAGCQRHRDPER